MSNEPTLVPWLNEVQVQCVYCYEWVSVEVDPQDHGSMIQDCDVCCRPMKITVQWLGDGQPHIGVEPAY